MPRPTVYRNRQPVVEGEILSGHSLEDGNYWTTVATKKEIRAYLDSRDIEYTTRMSKDELLDLL